MKKLLFIIILLISSVLLNAQILLYRTTECAVATVNEYTGRYTWGYWEKSNMSVIINENNNVVTILSPTIQKYYIYEAYNNGKDYLDTDGGHTIKFYVRNQDNYKGELRIRVDKYGGLQMYIDFADYAWVYNIIED